MPDFLRFFFLIEYGFFTTFKLIHHRQVVFEHFLITYVITWNFLSFFVGALIMEKFALKFNVQGVSAKTPWPNILKSG